MNSRSDAPRFEGVGGKRIGNPELSAESVTRKGSLRVLWRQTGSNVRVCKASGLSESQRPRGVPEGVGALNPKNAKTLLDELGYQRRVFVGAKRQESNGRSSCDSASVTSDARSVTEDS